MINLVKKIPILVTTVSRQALDMYLNIVLIFPVYRRILTPLQQTVFEIMMTKEKIARDEKFLLFSTLFSTLFDNCFQCFDLYLCTIFVKVVCCKCVAFNSHDLDQVNRFNLRNSKVLIFDTSITLR